MARLPELDRFSGRVVSEGDEITASTEQLGQTGEVMLRRGPSLRVWPDPRTFGRQRFFQNQYSMRLGGRPTLTQATQLASWGPPQCNYWAIAWLTLL